MLRRRIARTAELLVPIPGIASMETHVSYRRCQVGSRRHCLGIAGLVYITEADPVVDERAQSFFQHPTGVAHLGYQREVVKGAPQFNQEALVLLCKAKAPRKLQQQAAQFSRLLNWLDTFLECAHFLRVQNPIMRESAIYLGREEKLRIGADLLYPQPRDLRTDGLIEGGIDLDGVEILRQKLERMKSTRFAGWVYYIVPMCIGPTGRSTVEIVR